MIKKSSAIAAFLGALVLFACEGPVAGLDGISSDSRSILPTPTSTSTFLQNYADTRLVAGYKAEVKYYNPSMGYVGLTLHYGFNGWKDVKEVPLNIVPGQQDAAASVDVPDWATTLDYVVFALQADGTKLWDNRGEVDYHVPVFKAITTVSVYEGRREITLISKMDNPIIHFGLNNWQTVTEQPMNRAEYVVQGLGVKKYTTIISGLPADASLDYCFRDANDNWLNNDGANWIHHPGNGVINVWPADYQSEIYYMDLLGLPVVDYFNGAYRTSAELALTHSGAYFGVTLGSVPYGDHTFVLDVIKDGFRYYGKVSQRFTAYGTNVYLTIKKTTVR